MSGPSDDPPPDNIWLGFQPQVGMVMVEGSIFNQSSAGFYLQSTAMPSHFTTQQDRRLGTITNRKIVKN